MWGYQKGCRCLGCKRAWALQRSKYKASLVRVNKEILKARKQACADCGWNKIPSVLEFHHTVVDPSNIPLGTIIGTNSTIRFLQELDKGVFLCPNCHRCRHYDPVKDRVDTTNKTLR